MRKKSKLVYGVGINDANYDVQKFETIGYTDSGKSLQKLIWICPFYSRWRDMMRRCYSLKFHENTPTYIGCYTVPEWHYFMTFRQWMIQQDWECKELDKDLLFPGNKVYGPDTCVFVEAKLNGFITESTSKRGIWPIGVYFHCRDKKFIVKCKDIITNKQKDLGRYNNSQEAHQAWLAFKLQQAYILAAEQTDPRIAKALIERYQNYGKLD